MLQSISNSVRIPLITTYMTAPQASAAVTQATAGYNMHETGYSIHAVNSSLTNPLVQNSKLANRLNVMA